MSNVITEFLAEIGFQVDSKSLGEATKKIAQFGAVAGSLAMGAIAGIAKIAQQEAALADASQKLSIPAEKLEELQFAAEQTGAGADALLSSLQGLKKANPGIKDTSKLLEKAAQAIRGMSDSAAEAYAQKMGIDPSLLPMLRQNISALSAEYREMYAASGRNANQAAADGKAVMQEFGRLKSIIDLLIKTVAGAFLCKVRASVELFRKTIVENFGKIKSVLQIVIGFILRLGNVIASFIYRIIKIGSGIIGWFDSLDKSQKKLIIGLGLLLVAWKKLNLGFLTSPIGLVVAALTSLFLLIDDYLTWAEGGDSLLDWSAHAETIQKVVNVVKVLWDIICALGNAISRAIDPAIQLFHDFFVSVNSIVKNIGKLFYSLFTGDLSGAIEAAKGIWQGYSDAVINTILNLIDTIAGFFGGLWESVTEKFPDFGEWAGKAAQSIKNIFGEAVKWLKDKLRSVTGWLPDWIKKKIGLGDIPEEKEQSIPKKATAAQKASQEARQPIPDAPKMPNIRPLPSGPMLRPSAMATQQTVNNKQEIKVDAKTQITVNGAQSPEAVAGQVGSAQKGFAADIARHTQGAVR